MQSVDFFKLFDTLHSPLDTYYDSLFTELAPEVLERTEAVPR